MLTTKNTDCCKAAKPGHIFLQLFHFPFTITLAVIFLLVVTMQLVLCSQLCLMCSIFRQTAVLCVSKSHRGVNLCTADGITAGEKNNVIIYEQACRSHVFWAAFEICLDKRACTCHTLPQWFIRYSECSDITCLLQHGHK